MLKSSPLVYSIENIWGVKLVDVDQEVEGIQTGMVNAVEMLKTLGNEVKQSWENPEGYQARLALARDIREQAQAYDRAFNTEIIHNERAHGAGYITAEALQYACGEGIVKEAMKAGVKVVTKGVRIAEGMGEGTKLATSLLPVGIRQRTNQLLKGEWMKTTEKMSERAAKYQKFITGQQEATQSYKLNGVKFDGITAEGVLVDAKSGYKNFINKEGGWQEWFTGHEDLVKQAERQIEAAQGIPIEWHFEHKEVKDLVEQLISKRGLQGIKFVHTPL